MTVPGFAWQRPGPAELPADRRPDRQDRGLWALALQVQSKAGLGGWGLHAGTQWQSCGHTHTHPPEPCAPPAHISLPSSARAHPGLCWGSGGVQSHRPPCKGLSAPQDQVAPPGWSTWAGSPPEHKEGVCAPQAPWAPAQQSVMQPGGALCCCLDVPPCQGQSLQAAASTSVWGLSASLSVCLSCLQLLPVSAGGLAGGGSGWGDGGAGRGGWGLRQREHNTCWGSWGRGGRWRGGWGVAGLGTALAAVWLVLYV